MKNITILLIALTAVAVLAASSSTAIVQNTPTNFTIGSSVQIKTYWDGTYAYWYLVDSKGTTVSYWTFPQVQSYKTQGGTWQYEVPASLDSSTLNGNTLIQNYTLASGSKLSIQFEELVGGKIKMTWGVYGAYNRNYRIDFTSNSVPSNKANLDTVKKIFEFNDLIKYRYDDIVGYTVTNAVEANKNYHQYIEVGNAYLQWKWIDPIIEGAATATVTKTCTGLTNGSWCNLTSATNATSGTVNFTGIVSNIGNLTFGSYFYNNPLTNGTRSYQISLNLSNANGVSNTTHVFGNGTFVFNSINSTHINTNINTTGSNATLLPMWFENISVDNQTALAWVNVTQNFTGVQVYSGGANYTYNNSLGGSNTFVFFDDFSGDLSKWTILGSPVVSSGQLRIIGDGSNWNTNYAYTVSTFSRPFIMEWNEKGSIINEQTWSGFNPLPVNSIPSGVLYKDNAGNDRLDVDATVYGSGLPTTLNLELYRLDVLPTSGYNLYRNGTVVGTESTKSGTNKSIGFNHLQSAYEYYDDVRVRKYASPEPTWSTWSSQQLTQTEVNVYAQPQNHPTSENKTTSYDNVSINLTLTPGTPIQNIQLFGNWSGTITATITLQVTANATMNEEKALSGYYYNNITYTAVNDETNIKLTIPISNATFTDSTYKGSLNTTGTNITSSGYNATHLTINISSLTTGSYNYNITIPYNNAPMVSADDQIFHVDENATVVFSASDNESNPLTCYGKLNGTEIESCSSPHDFGLLAGSMEGTNYTYYLNVSEVATVSSQWTNVTALITVFEHTPPSNITNVTGNFFINWSWDAGVDTDFIEVRVNGTFKENNTAEYYNFTEAAAHGTYEISLRGYVVIHDYYTQFVNQTTSIPNNPIIITNISDSYSLAEGQSLYIDADYTDADGDNGTFARNFSEGSFNTSTGVLTWTTVDGDQGTYNWQINVSDGYGSVSTKEFTVTVADSTPGTPTNLTNITGNFFVRYDWIEGANTNSFNVSYNGTWTNGSSATFINESVGAHGWGNITIYGYNSTLNVLSSGVSQNTQVPNNVPVQDPIGDKSVNEMQWLNFTVSATDADLDIITYGTNATKGTFNTTTGNFTWQPNYTESGVYTWYFNSSDNYGGVATETITVTVNNIPLSITDFTPATDPTTTEGATQTFNITLNRTANVTWYINGSEAQTNASIITAEYINSTAGIGTYNITVSATDGIDTVSKTWIWTVIEFVVGTPVNLTNATGNFFVRYDWEAGINTDTFNVSYNGSWTNGSSATTINQTVGAHGWGNITVYGYNETRDVLSDSVSQNTQVPNNVPVQDPIGDKTTDENEWLNFTVSATDPDSDIITYGTNATKGTFNTTTGEFSWLPTYGDSGTYTWYFNSSDGYGGVATETITVTVNNIPLTIMTWWNSVNGANNTAATVNDGSTVVFTVTTNWTSTNISWKVNGVEEQNTSSSLFQKTFHSVGTYNVTAQAIDTYDTSNIIYTVVSVVSGGGGGTNWDWLDGYVKNAGGTPISGATVSSTAGSTTTSAAGYYSFGYVFLDGQTYNITASASGYNSTSQLITFDEDHETLNFTLAAGPPTAPVITTSSPVSPVSDVIGATRTFSATWNQAVNVTWYLNGTEIQTNTSVTTASYTNTSAAEGSWNIMATGTNDNGTASTTWIWTVGMAYSVSGYVLDETGSAFSGATVSYSGGSNVSNASGYWFIQNVVNGTYTFTAAKSGYVSNSTSVTVNGSDVVNVNFTISSVDNAAIYAKLLEIESRVNEIKTPQKASGFGVLAGLAAIILCLVVRRRRK